MLKKLYILFFIICFNCSFAFAETVTVQALDNFSTANPQKLLTVKILNDLQLDDNLIIKCGNIVTGKITDITKPKRLKRDAKFSFKLTKVEDTNGNVTELTKNYVGKYTTELNTAGLAKSAALSVGNHFVKGISIGFYAAEGAIKNEKGNRVKSTANSVYENSPLSLIEKGQEIQINEGALFYLKFDTYKTKEEEK